MTLSPFPADLRATLAHLDDAGLARHALAAVRELEARGVDLPPVLIDELEEVELECVARVPGALATYPAFVAEMAANINA
jgi:hypothetical protein